MPSAELSTIHFARTVERSTEVLFFFFYSSVVCLKVVRVRSHQKDTHTQKPILHKKKYIMPKRSHQAPPSANVLAQQQARELAAVREREHSLRELNNVLITRLRDAEAKVAVADAAAEELGEERKRRMDAEEEVAMLRSRLSELETSPVTLSPASDVSLHVHQSPVHTKKDEQQQQQQREQQTVVHNIHFEKNAFPTSIKEWCANFYVSVRDLLLTLFNRLSTCLFGARSTHTTRQPETTPLLA